MIRHPSSYFVWLPLPDGLRADMTAMALMSSRIAVSTAEPFATGVKIPHALRLALGSVEPDRLRLALKRVREAIGDL